MRDYLSRAGKVILIILVVVLGLIIAIRSQNNEREVVVAGQTPEKVADMPQNAVEDEYETILMNVSGFCKGICCCGKWADGQTASGHWIQFGDKFVAAPLEYSFGTIMDVPGYGIVPVLDRGGAIKDNKLDLYFDDHQAALNFGRQQLKVKIIK